MSKLDQARRDRIPPSHYAFPNQEKEPLNDAAHVRNAIARFNQVKNVTDKERDEAWKRIKSAAKKFGVEMKEEN
jgi:cell division protein FtsX